LELYLSLLLEYHLYLMIFVAIVYLIEKETGMMLIIEWFRYKKDVKSALGTADRESVLYFLYQIGFAVYKIYIEKEISRENFSFIIWILIVFILAGFVRWIYLKFQGVDPSKPDFEGRKKMD